MPAGNYSALNMVFSLMVKCHLIKPSEEVMMPSILSSVKPAPENMSQELYFWILNQQLLMKSELEHTDNYSTQNNLFLARKMLPTTSPEVITPLVKKLSIFAQIELENSLITALVFKDFQYSTQSVVELDQDQVHSYQKDFQSIMERNQNSVSQFIPHPRYQQQSLNPTTQFYLLTHSLNTPMLPLCWITKPSI